jgi:hypothetical protein
MKQVSCSLIVCILPSSCFSSCTAPLNHQYGCTSSGSDRGEGGGALAGDVPDQLVTSKSSMRSFSTALSLVMFCPGLLDWLPDLI